MASNPGIETGDAGSDGVEAVRTYLDTINLNSESLLTNVGALVTNWLPQEKVETPLILALGVS